MFTVETDASENAVVATLSQSGRPVTLFSRLLSDTETRYSSVEKEAQAIIESDRKWRQFLFLHVPYQALLQNQERKLHALPLEMAYFHYDIIYRPGNDTHTADACSRTCSALDNTDAKLKNLHEILSPWR
ncbi:hypothetical protein PR048_006911 [Dryococelus australis]|uniref:Reverse transcriptase RNase H-like domain-containing protein n=1 Tax=Dryococelus australis TaxID=614101 RepID=A0ABQ9ICB4_9NEOP|nr:hypothetical protein PR048_006911 [Dryococelus australis]